MPVLFIPRDKKSGLTWAGQGLARRGLPLLATALIGALLTLGSFLVLSTLEEERAVARFERAAEEHLAVVETNIALTLDSLVAASAFFDASHGVSRTDFGRLVTPLIRRNKAIQALEWAPRVTAVTRAGFEAEARQSWAANFAMSERDPNGKAMPAGQRADYYPVYYVEPLIGNEVAVGFDLGSNPARRAALEHAAGSGDLVATSRIVLVQETANQYGFLVFRPVYAAEADTASELGRRQGLLGFVLGVFRVQDMVEKGGMKEPAGPSELGVALFDRSAKAGEQLLYPKMASYGTDADLPRGQRISKHLDVGGRSWDIVIFQQPQASVFEDRWLALVVGFLVTMAAVGYQKNSLERVASAALFAREISKAKLRLSEAHRIARLGYLEFDSEAKNWRLGEGADQMLGVTSASKTGPLADFLSEVEPDDRARLLNALEGAGALALNMELRVGERILHALSESNSEGESAAQRVITLQDVTQRHLDERERGAMIERMAEASRLESLGTLAGGVAHEINTPTQYIGDNLAFLQDWLPRLLALVKAAREAGETQEWSEVDRQAKAIKYDFAARELPAAIEQSIDGAQKIASIVKAIKDFSYPSGKTIQAFDLNRAVDVACTVSRNQWKYVAEVTLDLADDLPLLYAIEGEINQVLLNLIVNAAQAIEEKADSRLGTITISTTLLTDERIEIAVKDSGAGIAPENHSRLFELFFTTKAPGAGTGQGLAISKAIILRHGGSISVESEIGKGACFRIQLPVRGPTAPDEKAVS